jgi:hypothetical protein
MTAHNGETTELQTSARDELRTLLLRFGIELLLYGALLTAYLYLVLRFLSGPLLRLSQGKPWDYAWVALAIIVGQAVVLERITSFLVEQLRLERVE